MREGKTACAQQPPDAALLRQALDQLDRRLAVGGDAAGSRPARRRCLTSDAESACGAARIRLILVLALLTASGCATVTRGVSQSLVIETAPAGATAELSTGESCETPCSFRVRRRGEFSVTVRKTGYATARAIVTSRIDGTGMALGGTNVVLGGRRRWA